MSFKFDSVLLYHLSTQCNSHTLKQLSKVNNKFRKQLRPIIIKQLTPNDWILISKKNLSEDFIREFKDKVFWYFISKYQTLTEDFIREFKHKVYWSCISRFQTLSEDFIREFQHKVVWVWISRYQTLSEDFIREFQHNKI